jgi:hypothetical protein
MKREDIARMARWKQIPSFPEYEVSDCGMVKRGNKLLSQSQNAKGYPRVQLSTNGRNVSRVVHALVAEAFIGARPSGLQIRHLDGDQSNNDVSNLAYGTAAQNEADKALHGTKATGDKNGTHTKPEKRSRGSCHGKTALHENDVIYIKAQLDIGGRGVGAKLARTFGVPPQTISDIKSGRVWSHV